MSHINRSLSWFFLAWLSAVTGLAQTRPFELGGQTVDLDDVSPEMAVYFRAFRPNLIAGGWSVDVVISNRSTATFTGPFVLRFAQAEQVGSGVTGARPDREGVPFLDVTAQFPQGASAGGSTSRSWVVQMGRGVTAPKLRAEVFGRRATAPVPLLLTRTLKADGLPLEGVVVDEIGPVAPVRVKSGRGGWLTLEARPGVRGWRFAAEGRAPSFRPVPAGLLQGVSAPV